MVARAAEAHTTNYPPVPFKASLDFKYVVENIEALKLNAQNRFSDADPEMVAELYAKFTQQGRETDALRQARNDNAKAMKGKMERGDRDALIAAGQELKQKLVDYEARLKELENALQSEGQRLPNLTHPDVPTGGEENAHVLREVGTAAALGFEARNHVDIMEDLGLVDFDAASAVSGSKFYYLRGAAALLELALVNMAVQKCVAKGFTPMTTPDLVRAPVLEKCGFQPRMANTQTYSVVDSDLCLTGTAEVPLGGMYMDKIIEEKALPIKMAALGHCFRTEAGAGGAAGKGLYRVHQFSKVEMFVVATPAQAEECLAEILAIEEEMFAELGLHFKVMDMPSGDLGAPAFRKFDIEAWMPGLQRYGEISSASNCTDYQARRLNIRYRVNSKLAAEGANASGEGSEPPQKKHKKAKAAPTAFCHTLNGTACAVPRMIVAIIENNQQADGTVLVPEALRPFMAGLSVIEKPDV